MKTIRINFWNEYGKCILYFAELCGTFASYHLFYELWYVRRICERSLSKTLLQSTKNVLSETTILFRSSHQRCSKKNLFLKISQYSQEKIYVPWSLFLIKLQDWSPATLFRIDPNTGFSCEYCGLILNYRPLSLPFSSQFLKGLKKIHSKKSIWHKKYENTFHAAEIMKRNHCNVPLWILIVFMHQLVLQTCAEQLISGVEFQVGQKKPIWNLSRYEFHIIS